jgi:hypothetical protein
VSGNVVRVVIDVVRSRAVGAEGSERVEVIDLLLVSGVKRVGFELPVLIGKGMYEVSKDQVEFRVLGGSASCPSTRNSGP